jgi:antitoxin ParD1/3/4
MNVSLTTQLEELVQQKVSSGRYNSASEVIREALRLLEERDELKELKLQALKKDIALGLDQADRGELVDSDQVFTELRKKNAAVNSKK